MVAPLSGARSSSGAIRHTGNGKKEAKKGSRETETPKRRDSETENWKRLREDAERDIRAERRREAQREVADTQGAPGREKKVKKKGEKEKNGEKKSNEERVFSPPTAPFCPHFFAILAPSYRPKLVIIITWWRH